MSDWVPGSWECQKTLDAFPVRSMLSPGPGLSPAFLGPAGSVFQLSHFSDSQFSLSLLQVRKKRTTTSKERHGALRQNRNIKPTEELCSDKNCHYRKNWRFKLWHRMPVLSRPGSGLSRNSFWIFLSLSLTYKPSVPVLKKNRKTKRILLVSFSERVCICIISHRGLMFFILFQIYF